MEEVLKLVKGQAKYHAKKVSSAPQDVASAVEAGMQGGAQDLDGYLASCHKGGDDGTEAERQEVGSKSSVEGHRPCTKVGPPQKQVPRAEPGTPKVALGKVLGDLRKGSFAPQASSSNPPRDSPRSSAVLDPAVLEILHRGSCCNRHG